MNTTSIQGEDGNKPIDVNDWLKEHKLDHIGSIFDAKNIVIEELIDFSNEELKLN